MNDSDLELIGSAMGASFLCGVALAAGIASYFDGMWLPVGAFGLAFLFSVRDLYLKIGQIKRIGG